MSSLFELQPTALTGQEIDSANETRDVDNRIRREQAHTLLAGNQSFSVSGFILATAFGLVFWWEERQSVVAIWIVLMNVSQAARLLLLRHYAATPPASQDPLKTIRWLCVGIAITSAGWGSAPWLFFPVGNEALTALMMVVLLGMVSGGLASVTPYRPAVYCLVVPALTGLATAMLSFGDLPRIFLGICAAAYIVMTLKFGLHQNAVLESSMRIRLERERLAARLEEQIRVVEQASLEKTRFFASASHDLRQPLHSIGLLGSALIYSLERDADIKLAESLMRCVDSLESSFSSMLDVSKLDAGVIKPEIRAVALSEVFQQLQSVFSAQAQNQDLALRFRTGNHWVRIDPALLERILSNLLHNALKFTQSGGVVVVARRRGTGISVEVWDTGPGIPEHELSRIFDEFYQVGNAERDRSRGLGMGLAIVRRLANLLKLPVQVKSLPGKGTVIKLLLPSSAPGPRTHANSVQHRSLPGQLSALRVLIVDDEESVRASMVSALRFFVSRVESAEGIDSALEMSLRLEAAGQPIDIVVTDFRLRGDEDGLVLIDKLCAALGRQVPALLVTGDTAPERVRRAQASGIPVLYKPVRIQSLADSIRERIAEHAVSTPAQEIS